jgi:hypothetical protein
VALSELLKVSEASIFQRKVVRIGSWLVTLTSARELKQGVFLSNKPNFLALEAFVLSLLV